jgi:hypothetical protein
MRVRFWPDIDTDINCHPLIIIDNDGSPVLALVIDGTADNWVMQIKPHEVSAVNALIGRWHGEIGPKMRAWHDAHERSAEEAFQRLPTTTLTKTAKGFS